jgi:acetyl-CoA carboxylase biotin carboxyl carrier protein
MYYAQPEPGKPPYVSVGARVKKGDTIGLVEVMKTFNAIPADADGEVVAIHVRDEELLEPGQPLISIRVDA